MNNTTRERVERMTANAADDFGSLYSSLDLAGADIFEELDEHVLSVDVYRVARVWLAIGGPSHYLDVTLDDDGDVVHVDAVAAWGRDVAEERILDTANPLYRLATDATAHVGPIGGER